MGLKGCAMATASATASTPTTSPPTLRDVATSARAASVGAAECDLLRRVSRPLASASLTMTCRPAWCACSSASPADCSMTFQVACTQSNSSSPVDVVRTCSAARRVSPCSTPESVRPMRTPCSALSRSSPRSTSALPSTPLACVAECTWYKRRCGDSSAVLCAHCRSRFSCVCSLTSCGAPPVSTCQLAAYVYPHLLPTTKALGGIPREASHSARNTSDAPYERAASK
mmetsp:Transcript_3191/g.7856  ORF Transcript_3191/g.7856 Transcript_3191/m.7856 type:complete len:228 (+) Transcript_3191:307-990(+)